MISYIKIFNQVNHVNLRHLRTIELSATDSVRTRLVLGGILLPARIKSARVLGEDQIGAFFILCDLFVAGRVFPFSVLSE